MLQSRARGFTLIELVITAAIVAVLASIALPLAELTVKRTKEQELRAALREIRGAIDQYKLAVDQGRVRSSKEKSGYPPSLRALADGVEDVRSPDKRKIYFLRRVPRDPLFPDAETPPESTWGLRSYASPPDHPQDGDDVYDVYSRSPDVGLNNIAYRLW